MARKSGRYGEVWWDPAGGSALVKLASINHFTMNMETEMEDVTCFGDTNRVYIPGMKNIEGDIEGVWDSAELALFKAAGAAIPGMLKLVPNNTEPTFYWTGLAYMSAEIDVEIAKGSVTGSFSAAGPWTGPDHVVATGATAGTPGTWTPTGAEARANLASMTGITATPATTWTAGQHMVLLDASKAYWNGTTWVAGQATVELAA